MLHGGWTWELSGRPRRKASRSLGIALTVCQNLKLLRAPGLRPVANKRMRHGEQPCGKGPGGPGRQQAQYE